MPSLIDDLLSLLDPELRYEFDERAGTIEADAEQPRELAELLALVDLLRSHPGALTGVTAFEVDGPGFVVTTDIGAAHALGVQLIRVVNLAEVIKTHFGGLASITRLEGPDTDSEYLTATFLNQPRR